MRIGSKREDLDPYDAKEQARGYAENLRAPFVILSNGKEHWFWNLERTNEQDAYRIERLPSREDMERLLLKNLQPPKPLLSEILSSDYLRRFVMTLNCAAIKFAHWMKLQYNSITINAASSCLKWQQAQARLYYVPF